MFGAPEWVGTVALMAGIAAVVAFGNKAVERLFVNVSYLLYGVYALFIVARASSASATGSCRPSPRTRKRRAGR